MGRKKLTLEPHVSSQERYAAFKRRRQGLFRKTNEVSVMCKSEALLFCFPENNEMYLYSSSNANSLIESLLAYEGVMQIIETKDKGELFPCKTDCDGVGKLQYKTKIPLITISETDDNIEVEDSS